MAFEANKFRQLGGNRKNTSGPATYTQASQTDNAATMIAIGYLNPIASILAVGDIVMISATDGADFTIVASIVDGVVTLGL